MSRSLGYSICGPLPHTRALIYDFGDPDYRTGGAANEPAALGIGATGSTLGLELRFERGALARLGC